MSAATNSLFPRSAIPADIGAVVRKERRRLGWSQERLARKAGVTRWTIMRLERVEGLPHLPTSHLVHALRRVLDLPPLGRGLERSLQSAVPVLRPEMPACPSRGRRE